MDVEPRYVDLPTGVTLPCVTRGDAGSPHLVLLHAIGDSWHSFERVLPLLPESLHTVVPTLRGHGAASRPVSQYSTSHYASDVVALMDALGIDAAVLAGSSSSGIVARRVALEHPHRVHGLALLGSPSAFAGNPPLEAAWEGTVSRLVDPIEPEFLTGLVDDCVATELPPDFRETLLSESRKVPAHVWIETFRGLLDDDTFDRLDQARCPTQIHWGDADAVLPRGDQDRLVAAIPGARLFVHEGVGHCLHWEDPQRTATDLAAYVAALAGRRARGRGGGAVRPVRPPRRAAADRAPGGSRRQPGP